MLKSLLTDEKPWMTICVVFIVVIVAIVGGVVVIVDSSSLSFQEYVTLLTGLAVGSGLLGIGRGIAASKNPEDILRNIAAEFAAEEAASGEPAGLNIPEVTTGGGAVKE